MAEETNITVKNDGDHLHLHSFPTLRSSDLEHNSKQ